MAAPLPLPHWTDRFRQVWGTPVSPAPEQARQVQLLYGVARPLLIGLIVMAVVFPLPGVTPPGVGLLASAGIAISCLPLVVVLRLVRTGRAALASQVFMFVGFVSAAISFMVFGGIRGPLSGVLIIAVMAGGMLGGPRGAIQAGVASLATITAQLWLELSGQAVFLSQEIAPVGSWISVAAFLGIAMGLNALYVHEMENSARLARESAARALRSEQKLADLVRHSPDGIAVLAPGGVIVSMNEALERIAGISAKELCGKRVHELPGVSDEALSSRLKAGVERSFEGATHLAQLSLKRPDGSPYVVEVHPQLLPQPDGAKLLQVVVRDVTERVAAEAERTRLERELRTSRRLESLGRLAGGVAHDFRNLLTPILANSEELLGTPRNEDERLRLDEIHSAGERAQRLTSQLLAFARKELQDVRVLDLFDVVHGLTPILRRLVREDVELRVSKTSQAFVRADRGQLEQVIVNLVANARDAMPGGGELRVEVSLHLVDAAEAAEAPGAHPGLHALLSVTDTGEGMTPDVLEQIWEPFFTTRPREQGHGLGLPTVQGIVAQSGGFVTVSTARGRGSTFRVFLPAVAASPDQPAVTPEKPAPPPRGLTALVADDEDLVRAVVVRVLRRAGFTVLTAANGAEALEVARAHAGTLDLLVTDVVMPVLAGPELAYELKRIRPDVRVLFISGYAETGVVQDGALNPELEFLLKPFTPNALIAKVNDVLGRA